MRRSNIVKKAAYPEAVINRFDRLRGELPFSITLFASRGYFYVVRQEYERGESGKLKRSRVEYIGKITNDGIFKFNETGTESEVEVAKAILKEYGESQQTNSMQQANEIGINLSNVEMDILANLTMNARMPPEMLASNVDKPERIAITLRNSLKQRLSLSFIPDIRLTKIGFLEFFIFIKFADRQPNPELAKAELENVEEVQFAAFTAGEYDMLMFIIAESNEKLAEIVRRVKSLTAFSSLDSKWGVSYFYKTKSFVPLRPQAMKILAEKVWHRSRDSPRPQDMQLLESEFNVLKCLLGNGAIKFSEIERISGMTKGSARHAYERLVKREILPRVTISIDGAGVKSTGIILMKIINEKKFQESRKKLLEFIMQEEKFYVVNRFALVGDISSPVGVIFFVPVIKGNELDNTVSALNATVDGINTSKIMISSILVGKILFRRIDPYHSDQWVTLVSEYGIKDKEDKKIYDEETFFKLRKTSKNIEEDFN